VMGIECRADDQRSRQLIETLNDPDSSVAVTAERRVNAILEGGCQVPIAAYAEASPDDQLHLRALVGTPDGKTLLTAEATGSPGESDALGRRVGQDLIDQGAARILEAVYAEGG